VIYFPLSELPCGAQLEARGVSFTHNRTDPKMGIMTSDGVLEIRTDTPALMQEAPKGYAPAPGRSARHVACHGFMCYMV